ncbi:hypothetical protein EST38_g10687 [Candolleomyces aberdarensis]|uniref:Nephrocystin 3-like N-terminal domain-containing protein n=1 Tax=Candolleomyces aberdarensis TaxID=2316362 RepID=A0A4Q2D9M2_9AGAR|nr:hypothetical protein EST38_g10687 [Candolleomyces aberdarensis]
MSPKPKKGGTKPTKQKQRRRDKQAIAHDLPTAERSSDNVSTSMLMEEAKALTVTQAKVLVSAAEALTPSFANVGPSTAATPCRRTPPVEHTAAMSIFPSAQNFKIDSFNVHSFEDSRKEGWKTLLENVASNAFHDSNARFDAPKCDEDTRVEVTKELTDWIRDREAPQRLLCMTGAAGAGKSALQQTIAEQCSDSNTLGSAFFFSAGDPTRNNLSRIVPTIACQLGLHNPALRDAIGKAIEDNPLIFRKRLGTQMDTLIVAPFQRVSASGGLDSSTFPHAILIDGLDECSGEDNQDELLSTIKCCLLDNDLPFRIFIASRPEWAIRTALDSDPEGYLYEVTYHIKLSDMYDATSDIRRYLWTRLRGIGSRSRDRRAQSPLWPTKEDIEKLVVAASGQFIYAATVVKYVSERRGSPVDRLRAIINWTPEGGQQTRPLELLDTLYRNILSNAKELYEAVDTNRGRDFLSLVRAHQINSGFRMGRIRDTTHNFDEILGLEEGGHEVLFSDLHSLILVYQHPLEGQTKVAYKMFFYHRSFSEFLDSKFRAQHLFVSEARVRQYVVESCLQKLLQPEDFWEDRSFHTVMSALRRYSDNQITYVDDLRLIDFTRNNGWGRIDERFSTHVERGCVAPKMYSLARFICDAIQRLKDDLHEHELADIVQSYFDKWKEKYGFTVEEEEEEEAEEEEDPIPSLSSF